MLSLGSPSCTWNPRGPQHSAKQIAALTIEPCQRHRASTAQKVMFSATQGQNNSVCTVVFARQCTNRQRVMLYLKKVSLKAPWPIILKSRLCELYEYTKNKKWTVASVAHSRENHFLRFSDFNTIFDIEIYFLIILWNIWILYHILRFTIIKNFCYS